MDLEILTENTIELVRQTGEFIIEKRKNFTIDEAEQKGTNDFVSYVDKEAEKKLVDGLSEILPEAGFLVEEKTAGHDQEDYLWIVDPLDGTTNFIHDVAPHSISVALSYKGETVIGIVYELGHEELFFAHKNSPAYLNKREISVSKARGLNDSLVATGFHTSNFSRLENQLNVVRHVVKNSHGLRRHGSAAVDLVYVAAGRFDAFFEYGLNPWDVAAGAFIVKQAGGLVAGFTGEENYLHGQEIVAGSKGPFNDLLEVLKKEM